MNPPVPLSNKRIIGYDCARAGAFLGMVLVNFAVLVGVNESDPAWLNFLIEIIKGRAAATFVVLAGVGLSLLTKSDYLSEDSAAIKAKRLTLLKRSLFLLVIGLFNFAISPISDILHFYAVYIAIGAHLLTLSNLSLALIALATITARPLVMTGFDFVKNWGYFTVADSGSSHLLKMIGHFLFNGCFPVIPWVAFVFIGMWVGRQDFSDRSLRKNILLAGIWLVAFAESVPRLLSYITSSLVLDLEGFHSWFEITAWDAMPLFMISAMGTALVVISLSMMLTDRYGNEPWIMPFISMGQTTLTLYIIHILFGGFLLRVVEALEMETFLLPVWGTVLFFIVALVLSRYWSKRFQKGPLEWLMRRFLLLNNKLPYTQKVPVLPS